MSRAHMITDPELKHLIITSQIGALAAVRGAVTDGISTPGTPSQLRKEHTFTLEVLDGAIAALEAQKEIQE